MSKEELISVSDRLDRIETKLDAILNSSDKLDSHITFVESVYDIVKAPFSRALSVCSYDSNAIDLPDNEKKK